LHCPDTSSAIIQRVAVVVFVTTILVVVFFFIDDFGIDEEGASLFRVEYDRFVGEKSQNPVRRMGREEKVPLRLVDIQSVQFLLGDAGTLFPGHKQ